MFYSGEPLLLIIDMDKFSVTQKSKDQIYGLNSLERSVFNLCAHLKYFLENSLVLI